MLRGMWGERKEMPSASMSAVRKVLFYPVAIWVSTLLNAADLVIPRSGHTQIRREDSLIGIH